MMKTGGIALLLFLALLVAWGCGDDGADSDAGSDADADADTDTDTDTDADSDTGTEDECWNGDFSIGDAALMAILAPYECITGTLTINTHLEALELPNLVWVGENLNITGNSSLANLDGLSNLSWIGGSLVISNNEALSSLAGLSACNLGSGHGLRISGNPSLTTLTGLGSISHLGSLSIVDNAALENLNGMGNCLLQYFEEEMSGGYLEVRRNPLLVNVDGLAGLYPDGEYYHLWIDANDSLENLDGLHNFSTEAAESCWFLVLEIMDNASLLQCEACELVALSGTSLWYFIFYGNQPDSCSDFCSDAQCMGMADFTPCEIPWEPWALSYHICIDGGCRSPGCGDPSCNVPGPGFPLADTNQRLCYGDSAQMICPAPDEEFYGQDAQYGWDASHDSGGRFTRDLSTEGEPVVTDEVTGLVWQGCALGLAGDDCSEGEASLLTWNEALFTCDNLGWGGETDWRLPSEYELMSIVDFGKTAAPSIDTTAFPSTPSDSFWSSSLSTTMYDAWCVYFDDFGAVRRGGNGLECPVRCVRGVPEAKPVHFTRDTSVAGEPTVLDAWTGLVWQGCSRGQTGDDCGTGSAESAVWKEALSYCEELDWGGQSDWRLPNISELKSIVENRKFITPPVDTAAFPATPEWLFWSSSSLPEDPSSGMFVGLDEYWGGSVGHNEGKGEWHGVRCVRAGSDADTDTDADTDADADTDTL